MSASKRQKEQDKAIRHLMDFINQSPKWSPLFDDLILQFMAPVARSLDRDIDAIQDELLAGPYHNMAFGYLFELMATALWNREAQTPIDDFLQQRGWREGTYGRRYLRTLGETQLEFLEITAVEPGRWIEVRTFGTQEKATRVIERAASKSLRKWDAIAARVYPEGKSRRFTGGILNLSHEAARDVQAQLDAVPADMASLYQEMLEEGDVEGVSVDCVDDIPEELYERLNESAFLYWAADVLSVSAPMELANTNNERLVMTSYRFPLNAEVAIVSAALSAHPDIVDGNDGQLTWLNSDDASRVLGWMRFEEQHMTFETNSVERGERGVNLIRSLLGDHVGQPMGVHQAVDDLRSTLPAGGIAASDLADNPEVQALLQKHYEDHYRKTLDEAIPMLDNESPRACAADPAKQHKVVDWLKYLENASQKSGGPAQDFVWMWEELGLGEFK